MNVDVLKLVTEYEGRKPIGTAEKVQKDSENKLISREGGESCAEQLALTDALIDEYDEIINKLDKLPPLIILSMM